MDEIQRYKIIYTETAIRDIEEKADYIAVQFHDPELSETWYLRLRAEIQQDLSTFPRKYPSYHMEPWRTKGVRLFTTRNDVVLYSVDDWEHAVYIRGVCTRGRDLADHLDQEDQ